MFTVRVPTRADPVNLRIIYSGLSEAAISLHVLTDPKHHPLHAGWVRRCRGLSARLKNELRDLRPMFATGLMSFLSPQAARPDADITAEIDGLLGTPADVLFYELAFRHHGAVGATGSPATAVQRAAAIIEAARKEPDEQRLLLDALNDPSGVKERIATFLSAYWDEAFREEWSRVCGVVDRAAEETAKLVRAEGLLGLMRTLAPAVRTNAEGDVIELPRAWEHHLTIGDDDSIALHVSYYLWPHVWVQADPYWPMAIVIPTSPPSLPTAIDHPADHLVTALRALGDATRLSLLRLVAETPRSTKELAQLLHMSEPGVSRHLTTLARAKLVRTKREGYYVLYEADTENLSPLANDLLGYLGGPSPVT